MPTPVDFDYIDRDSHVEMTARTERAVLKTQEDIRPASATGIRGARMFTLTFNLDPEEGKRVRHILRREGFTVASSLGPEWREPTC